MGEKVAITKIYGEKGLLGYTALEVLGFKVNPLTRRLEKTFAIEY